MTARGFEFPVRDISDDTVDPRCRPTLGHVDHRTVAPPYLRMERCIQGHHGDRVFTWDIRLTQPNQDFLDLAAAHSIEHMLLTFAPRHIPHFVDVRPMGCLTGYHLTTFNFDSYEGMLAGLFKTFGDCLEATEVPHANVQDCGWAANHSLEGAKAIARSALERRDDWQTIFK